MWTNENAHTHKDACVFHHFCVSRLNVASKGGGQIGLGAVWSLSSLLEDQGRLKLPKPSEPALFHASSSLCSVLGYFK